MNNFPFVNFEKIKNLLVFMCVFIILAHTLCSASFWEIVGTIQGNTPQSCKRRRETQGGPVNLQITFV